MYYFVGLSLQMRKLSEGDFQAVFSKRGIFFSPILTEMGKKFRGRFFFPVGAVKKPPDTTGFKVQEKNKKTLEEFGLQPGILGINYPRLVQNVVCCSALGLGPILFRPLSFRLGARDKRRYYGRCRSAWKSKPVKSFG